MDLASLIGIISGIGLIVSAIFIGGEVHNFYNIQGIMIVFGGTVAATLLTFRFKDVINAFKSAYLVFNSPNQDSQELINTMIKLGTISRRKGLLSLMDVKTNSPFLKRVCTLIADAADEETLRAAMRTEIDSMKMRHFIVQDVFRKMALYAPSFGMLGTLIGLIQMLSLLAEPDTLGPAMAVALLTTFYGSLLSTVIFLPIAGKLRSRTMIEVMNFEIVYQGAISILQDNNPMSVYEKLSSFVPPKQRKPMQSLKLRSK
ncbi:MAG: MotA/TolQ/ExbB proton channel family protein [Gammaproteobacteria bacterium]|nr:MotA/TolQ/ExbB proton channel family protein [Gammaproteobacteria bacterium]